MPPKPRGKSGSAAGGAGNKWEAGLLAAPIDEGNWTSSISLVAGNKYEDQTHIDMLSIAVRSEARKKFGIVHKAALFEEVKDLGNPKNKKGKDSPPHVDICETVRPIIENGDELPLPLLCRLIKFKILWLKQTDNQRISAELKAAADKEKGGAAGKGAKAGKDKPKSGKKGKGGKTPEPPSIKGGTKLKKRGEEDEKTYIDDEPDDGPSFYVIIAGFNHPHLITQLAEVGIYLDSVIKVGSEEYPQPVAAPLADENAPPKDEKTLAIEEEQRLRKEKEVAELEAFWRDYPLLIGSSPEGSRLHDTAYDKVTVKSEWIPENLEDDKDGEKKLAYGLQVYEEVAVKAYDVLDLKRQHKNFLKNLRLIHVPVYGEDSTARENSSAPEVDMRYYRDLMNTIPQESVSVPLIMHCMLEQVEASELGKEPPSEVQPTPRADGLEHGLSKHIGALAFKLALSETEKESLKPIFDEATPIKTPFKQPVLHNRNDEIAFRTGHLSVVNGFDTKEAELAMLEHIPLIGGLETPDLPEKKSLERAARLQELLHFCVCEELRPADIDHVFKQFVFESMDLHSTDESGIIIPSLPDSEKAYGTQAIPWDDPYPYYKCMIPTEEVIDDIEDAFPMPDGEDKACHGLAPAKTVPAGVTISPTVPASANGSRPPTPGILKKQTGCNSLSGSRNSVHFSDAEEAEDEVPEQQIDAMLSANLMEELIPSTHKRSLDEWCFAEHLDRHVLLQTMKSASFTLPYVDTYYHKRDHCLLVVMHNPHNRHLQNEMSWSKKLHSNVGVRNYQEHVAELITDWTISEEAAYHAHLLSDDVEQDITDMAKAAAAAAKETKKGTRAASKSPKGGRKGSAKSQSPKPSEVGVENYITDSYVRDGSLKAQKAEKEKLAAELAEEERLKAEKADTKRARSGRKTADSTSKPGKKKDEDRKPSRSGSKQKGSKEEPPAEPEPPKEEPEEPYMPFTGYDLGTSKLMHVSGKVSTLFPTDGAIIRSEKIDFVQGTSSVKTSVVKDGNVFMVHVVDPVKPETVDESVEKSETEESEKEKKEEKTAIGKHGSFTANFKDGMSMAFSTYGLQGQPDNYKKYEPAPYIAPAALSPSPAPDTGAKASPTKKSKGKDKTAAATPEPTSEEETIVTEVVDVLETATEPPFQQINLTCPDGLTVSFNTEESVTKSKGETRKLLVKQSYPYKTLGKHQCEEARAVPAMQETSRVIRSDGTVIKNMSNGDCTILYSDGAVSKMTGVPAGQSILQRPDSPVRAASARSGRDQQVTTPTRKGSSKKGKDQKALISQEELDALEAPVERKGQWITTAPTGERVGLKLDGTAVQMENALTSYASDPESRQLLLTREDHVKIVTHPSDMKIVEHEDGTRITTFLKDLRAIDSDEEKQDDTSSIRQQCVFVECPGYAAVEFNCFTSHCVVQFGTGTLLSVQPNGSYHICHNSGFNLDIDEKSRVTFVPNPKFQLVAAKAGATIPTHTTQTDPGAHEHSYRMSHCDFTTVETEDPDGNRFSVYNDGTNNVTLSEQYQEQIKNSGAPAVYNKHAPRFFVVHPNLTGTELLRYQDISDFLTSAEQDSTAAIIKEPVIEHPGVTAITVLKPYTQNSSQVWLGNFSNQNITPPGLKSRDLKTLPPREIVTPGPKFGTNVGKGLAIGSAVRTPSKPPVIECPKMLEIRQIIRYMPVSESCRQKLYTSLKRYGDHVCAREEQAEELMPRDPRSEEDKMACQLLQENFEKIKQADLKSLYETVTAPKIPSTPGTPAPRRTQADIERDRRERQEEKNHRQVLKKKEIPNYFDSELGRAFLISQAANPAAMMEKLAEDPNANVSTILRETSVEQLNEEDTMTSLPEAPSVTKSRPHGPTPLRASGARQNPDLGSVLPTLAAAPYSQPELPSLPSERELEVFRRQGVTTPKSLLAPISNSLRYDVTGVPRSQPVHVPDYLTKSSNFNSYPNQQFALVEENVRRQVKTSSVAHSKIRGIQVMPDHVDFGTLKEGITYSFTVAIKNVGIDSCRYKIRPPPPSTGLRLVFVPGPIAAGMKAELKLELYAIAIGVIGDSGTGFLSHDLEICTETDLIYLPVRANVLTADEYDNRETVDLPRGGRQPGVQIVTDKPPNDYGIVRPRKDLKVASNGSDAILSFLN
ncbi:sperm-associated antigen 17-like [Watersipora subatra]|uniref:sperm-associated antigen 17-like n=1 Tax=Watersipora subatra TaxID=2589382 RepID=UPI00355B1BC2